MGIWARGRRSRMTAAERDLERRDRFIARYSEQSLLQFVAVTLVVNTLAACAVGALTGWSNAVIVFVLWSLIEVIARWWSVRQVRRAPTSADAVPRSRGATADG